MEYEQMELQSPLCGLVVRNPVGQAATAVLENLTDSYDIDNLKRVSDEMQRTGVRNVVIDLSQVPVITRRPWLAFLDGGFAGGYGFETRYIGITVDEASAGEPGFGDYIAPKIAESLDAAVESLSR